MLISEFYQPLEIAIIWPEHLPAGVGKLIKYYKEFIQLLIKEDINVLVVYSNTNDLQTLKNMFGQDNIEFLHREEVSDIWIRDFGPFFSEEDGRIKSLKTLYKPSYYSSKSEINWFSSNDRVGRSMTDTEPERVTFDGYELILDGGNLIHNGLGTGIVTNRIISDNEHLFEHEIRSILNEKLGIEELYIIPSEPGDDTGHIDGLVRFLDPNTLAILKYPDSYISNPKYIDKQDFTESVKVTQKIAEYLAKQNFNIVRIPCSIPKKGVHKMPSKKEDDNTFENAAGNYMNFLRAGNKIFVPQYNNPIEDEKAYMTLCDYFEKLHSEIKVIKVPSDATPLAEYGGILNCITLQLFDEKSLKVNLFDQFKPVAFEEKGENNVSVTYFALKNSLEVNTGNYLNTSVIQVDLHSKSVSRPNILERYYPYRTPILLDPKEDDPEEFTMQLYLFPSSEIRKLWNLCNKANF